LRPPKTVIEIARKLTDAGFETWCVGGAVRDALLGIANQDWDLATAAPPEQTRKLFRRTIPVGIEFGTVGVLDRDEVMHEVTTFRRDVKHDGRHAVVEFGVSLVEDLKRRDFTINAIAYDPFGERLFDPFDGRTDLANRLVRAVGVPLERFVEDRLRVLRGIRFASRFGFAIESETWNAIVASAPFLGRLSAERVKQELDKTLEQAARPSEAFVLWQRAGAFQNLVPVLTGTALHVLLAVDVQPRPRTGMIPPRKMLRRQLRLATLFSDRSASETTKALKALRAPNAETAFVASLVERWQMLGREITRSLCAATQPDDATLRRWAAVIGRTRVRSFMRVAWARWQGLDLSDRTAGSTKIVSASRIGLEVPQKAHVVSLYRRLLHVVHHDPIEIADLAVDGDDLRSIKIPDGPHVGTLLREMLALVVRDPTKNSREALLDFAEVRFVELMDQQTRKPGRKRQDR
jgi:tRNA nucleotidyltransferase (CCA-adding enzyme)